MAVLTDQQDIEGKWRSSKLKGDGKRERRERERGND